MDKLKLIFIDVDNTLLDFDAYVENTLFEGFKKFHLPNFSSTVIDVFHEENNALWEKLQNKEITFDDLIKIRFEKIFHRLNIDFDGNVFESFFREKLTRSAIPVPHAYEMLAYLKQKYILAAASNGPYPQQLRRLQLAHMDIYFSYFFISEKLGCAKPSTRFFELAFREINENRDVKIQPKETCIIGDSLSSDIKGGKDFGMKTCFFNKHQIEIQPQADYSIKGLLETKTIF